jgi:hypothetical protein
LSGVVTKCLEAGDRLLPVKVVVRRGLPFLAKHTQLTSLAADAIAIAPVLIQAVVRDAGSSDVLRCQEGKIVAP